LLLLNISIFEWLEQPKRRNLFVVEKKGLRFRNPF
jgi:hypothetical protein